MIGWGDISDHVSTFLKVEPVEELIDPLCASVIVGKHWYHILSGEQLGMRMKKAWIGLPVMTGWRPESTRQLLLQTENLCPRGPALQFLKTGQDHLRCSDASLLQSLRLVAF